MPNRLRLLGRFGHKVHFDLDLEFAPAGLGHFEGRRLDRAQGIGVGLVQLELHFAQPVGDVFAVDAAHVDGPLVRVVWVYARGAVGRVEEFGDAAVDCGDGELSRLQRRER